MFAQWGFKTTYLIDNCGYVINEWESEFAPSFTAYMVEDGKMLRVSRSPISYGRLEKFDWEGNLVWLYDLSNQMIQQHHDIQPLKNGNILVLTNQYYTPQQAFQAGRVPELIGDELLATTIIELKPKGTNEADIVWQWNMLDHVVQNVNSTVDNYGVVEDHPELFDINYSPLGSSIVDWAHCNSINYNAELDQIMMSSRDFNELWIIDHSTTTEEAAGSSGGNSNKGGDLLYRWGNPKTYFPNSSLEQTLSGNHDARWITEDEENYGKIMIFNNNGNWESPERSLVHIIEPPLEEDGNYTLGENGVFLPNEIEDAFNFNDDNFFFSARMSGAHFLKNGNVLVCTALDGTFTEYDKNGVERWKYITPLNASGIFSQGDEAIGNTVFRAYKYSPEDSVFVGKELTPREPIEFNPIDYGCEIYQNAIDSVSTTNTVIVNNEVLISPNPFSNSITIESLDNDSNVQIYDYSGKLIHYGYYNNKTTINSKGWVNGLYFIKFSTNNGLTFTTKKVIKIN